MHGPFPLVRHSPDGGELSRDDRPHLLVDPGLLAGNPQLEQFRVEIEQPPVAFPGQDNAYLRFEIEAAMAAALTELSPPRHVEPSPSPDHPVPDSVSRRQMKLALLGAGMLDQVEAFVAGADRAVQISWADAVEFRREDPMLTAAADAFGLTSEQRDDLFRAAAAL
jgi:hypothetical protein